MVFQKIQHYFNKYKWFIIRIVCMMIFISIPVLFYRVFLYKQKVVGKKIFIEASPRFTGELDIPIDEETKKNLENISNLQSIIPITTSDFRIEYNYNIAKFQITLLNKVNGKDKFYEWLLFQNITSLPEERLNFIEK